MITLRGCTKTFQHSAKYTYMYVYHLFLHVLSALASTLGFVIVFSSLHLTITSKHKQHSSDALVQVKSKADHIGMYKLALIIQFYASL